MSHEIGKILIQKRQYKNALKNFKKLLNNKPFDLRANFLVGKIYYDLNNLNKSIIYFEKCNKIQPNTPNILFNLALTYQNMGKIEKAKQNYLSLITINPSDIKSYYGLFNLSIKNINSKFYDNLKSLVKQKNIPLFEKSLINFIFSKLEKKKIILKVK